MIYLLIGENGLIKDEKIAEIKNKCLLVPHAHQFDYDVLHAPKLEPADLKKALLTLPSFTTRRLIVIRSIQKLSPHNKELILDFIKQKRDHADLVLDSDDPSSQDGFIKQIIPSAKIVYSEQSSQKNVFDMTKAISQRKSTEALSILSELLSAGIHPLQIMGGLVWFWGKIKPTLSSAKFENGLEMLKEADLNIKRSRLEPEHAIEVAVVKLIQCL